MHPRQVKRILLYILFAFLVASFLLNSNLFNFYSFKSNSLIPKIIHQTYKTSIINEIDCYKQPWIKSWMKLNPDYSHIIWNDDSMKSVVDSEFSRDIQLAYEKLPFIVQKTDYFRYLILSRYGGVYSDIDTTCLTRIDNWGKGFSKFNVIVGLEWDRIDNIPASSLYFQKIQIQQWTIATTPNHKLMLDFIKSLTNVILSSDSNTLKNRSKIIAMTGPEAFTIAVDEYIKTFNKSLEEMHSSKRSIQFGDVIVHTETAFNTWGPHSDYLHGESSRALVQHHYSGEWKNEDGVLLWLRKYFADNFCLWLYI